MGLRIYFCGSVSGGRQDRELYASLISHLGSYGQVLTEKVGAPDMKGEAPDAEGECLETWLVGPVSAYYVTGWGAPVKCCNRNVPVWQHYNLSHAGEDRKPDIVLHDEYVEKLRSADVLIAEVTRVSHGVGYEIGRAMEMKKKILCLYRPSSGKRLSPMLAGAHNGDNVHVKHYQTEEEAHAIFKDFLGDQSSSS